MSRTSGGGSVGVAKIAARIAECAVYDNQQVDRLAQFAPGIQADGSNELARWQPEQPHPGSRRRGAALPAPER